MTPESTLVIITQEGNYIFASWEWNDGKNRHGCRVVKTSDLNGDLRLLVEHVDSRVSEDNLPPARLLSFAEVGSD